MARPLAGLAAPDEVIVNVAVSDATPPDGALDTEIGTDPGWATKLAEIVAVACVALTTVVAICVPFQYMTEAFEPVTKFVPVTVSVKAALPAPMLAGESCVIVGGEPGEALIVKRTMLESSVVPEAKEFDEPETDEPGTCTTTCTVPALAMFDAGTVAVNWVLLTKVVVSALPFQRIFAPETKPFPAAVMVNPALPAVALAGLRNVSAEEIVCVVRFVLKVSQAEASAPTINAVKSHPRECIRARSSLSVPSEKLGRRQSCECHPGTEEIRDDPVMGKIPAGPACL